MCIIGEPLRQRGSVTDGAVAQYIYQVPIKRRKHFDLLFYSVSLKFSYEL